MGTWGAGLYDDDQAGDLKNTISLISKVPVDGDRLLQLLEQGRGDCDPADEDGRMFWLVVADQFERRGIACTRAASMALSIIDSGADLSSAKERDADDKFLRKRAAVLDELRQRLETPRPVKPRKTGGKAPAPIFDAGEVYAFPAMDGVGWGPYRLPSAPPFEPNQWGALVVLATGRVFDWWPWCALASLTVDPARKPSLADAVGARLITHLQTEGAAIFIPNKTHATQLGLELLGRVELDPGRVKPVLSPYRIEFALELGWSIAAAAYSATMTKLPVGCELASLIAQKKA